MDLERDFKELLELLNKRKVEYLIVGGYALAVYGAPRATGDLDIWIKPEPDNARRLLRVLDEFGFGAVGLSEVDFTVSGNVIQLGVPPVRVDFLTSISGVAWDEAVKNRQSGTLGGQPTYFIGRSDFISNKRALGRARDLADIEALGE